ncbi:tyrosine-type recombinase/integrase [Micromonospora sp. WMMD1082]|uniref:tyrosine-type recombinase/integrase n=1 Tax=Micromonospora sp. WMMD1082 TaxID=3016104 RepID=UPI002416078E|nr:tyrosine-type recombinase/integrase [Micromonospora sp. WMMD1082]MDG4796237.1 tyrosine-type recombinase/integrase [Micromonospora sp. WMMD1082]
MPQSRMATPLDMLAAHLNWMRAGAYAANTIADAEKLLHRLHRELPEGLHASTGDEIAAWIAAGKTAANWSTNTVSTYYKHIARFYRWSVAGANPWLSFDPTTELRRPVARPGLPRPAGHDAVRRAIFDLEPKWRLVCRLIALAGLRPTEVATVRREDITEQAITIKGKGGKTRAIPTHPLIWEMVGDLPGGPLIDRPSGRPVTAGYITRSGARALHGAGIGGTLYPLRHWFGTEVQRAYKDLRVTQELMGHASPITTAVYTEVAGERKREAVAMLPFSVAGTPGAPEEPGAAVQAGDALPRPSRSEASGPEAAGFARRRRLLRRARP